MKLESLVSMATDKARFESLQGYLDFAAAFLEFSQRGFQAVIVSQNETNYRFYQHTKAGHFNVTRPVNANLMYSASEGTTVSEQFLATLKQARRIPLREKAQRRILCNSIYTIQQSIGVILDALPSGQSNKARKLNGDLFERLIRLLVNELGVECRSGVVNVPVVVEGVTQLSMSYQHDLIIGDHEDPRAIGSVKTSSKDRIDKVFIDKFLYNRLTEKDVPHFAIFLNDVQRKKTSTENRYGVNSTFLPGHFKGYTIKLNSLDGVYYCDRRPNMKSDPFLSKHIKTIDHFFCRDLWKFNKAKS